MSKRRGSRLFSGQPGLLLVSEDIPGITMPAPPPKDAPPLVDDEPEFDLASFHAEEDQEDAELGHDGPLRVFLGADTDADAPAAMVEVAEESDAPVFDVSALAMPAGPGDDDYADDDSALEFLSDTEEVNEEDIVELGVAPPVLAMGVSTELNIDDAADWDESPTQPHATPPSAPSTAVIRDAQPTNFPSAPLASSADIDPLDLPEPDNFLVEDEVADVSHSLVDAAPDDVIWDEDDTGFFEDAPTQQRAIPTEPPRPRVDTQGESRTFRAIPDKEDPSILPLLLILIGIVIMAVAFSLRYAGSEPVAANNTAPAAAPILAPPTTQQPAVRPQVNDVARNVGFLSIDSDKAANIYVDDRKVGITPVVKAQVVPGRHRVLAVEVETGKRKALTADVQQGEERRVRFAFQPVQQ